MSFLKNIFKSLVIVGIIIGFSFCKSNKKQILVFSKTAGFRHESIKAGKVALQKLGLENNILVDTSENAAIFTDDNLSKYSAIIFLSTTGDILDENQQKAMERYIQSGGGFVGIHAASDTEYDWKWFAKMVGGNFAGHPSPQKATIKILDNTHPSTKDLPKEWIRSDEWYNFSNLNPNVKVLAIIDEKTYQGGNHGNFHPMVWYHEYDGGRAFYTEFGHTDESYTEELFLKHVLGGINYAIGDNTRDLKKALAKTAPEPNRFSKQVIKEGLNEPMALAVDYQSRVFFGERRGNIYLYDPKKGGTKLIAKLEVDDFAGNGLMGMCLDPDFQYNNWLYIFYLDTFDNYNLSRFKINGDVFEKASEQVVFTFPFDKEPGAHNGGTIAFDDNGCIFISIGDNTPPWQANGFPPLDERPGRESYDAQRSSSNSQDFRGKILRIKPLANGKYEIPDGNLFNKDGKEGKPEIYAMGCRNPWRMSVDKKTGFVYWGEVGPDAGKDSTIGPRGYDEINQAKKSGNFGWPYFVGDNKPYSYMNLVNNQPDFKFDPLKPINLSRNNTGLKILPPVTKAFIWYPYANSPEFPEVGKGGRTACAGPVYHSSDYKNSTVKFPSYYDNKLFIFEWMRDWVMAVSMDEKGDFVKIEPVMQDLRFDHPTYMAFGPDGALYVLEYGFIWYSQNDNARLSKITFNAGNRPPVAVIKATDTIGNVPLKVNFSAKKSFDADGDSINYEWSFLGKSIDAKGTEQSYVYSTPGIYRALLTATDSKGAKNTTSLKIIVGNTYPKVDIRLSNSNNTFYFEGQNLDYQIIVSDKEDKTIDSTRIFAQLVYVPEGKDIFPMVAAHTAAPVERNITENPLIAASDCKACHAYNKKSVGPSFMDVSQKYNTNPKAIDYLSTKIIKGGAGVWGDHAMSAHPQISLETAKDMVRYILSLANEGLGKYEKKLAHKGSINSSEFNGKKGLFYITASYRDNGSNGMGTLETYQTLELKNSRIQSIESDTTANTVSITSNKEGFKNMYIGAISHGSMLGFDNLDLTNITNIAARINSKQASGKLEIRIDDAKKGDVIGAFEVKPAGEWEKWSIVNAPIKPVKGNKKLFFVFVNNDPTSYDQINVNWFQFYVNKNN